MKKYIGSVLNRTPKLGQVTTTFGLILLIVHSYSLVDFFYRIPSFLNFMNVGDLFATFAYYMAFALIESSLLLFLLLVIATILPKRWYAEKFEIINFPIIVLLAISADRFQLQVTNAYSGVGSILTWMGVTLLAILLAGILFVKIPLLKNAAAFAMDRVSIMNYVYLPIGFISLIAVGFRLLV